MPWWVCQVVGGLRDEVTWEEVQVDGEGGHGGHVAGEAVGAYVGRAWHNTPKEVVVDMDPYNSIRSMTWAAWVPAVVCLQEVLDAGAEPFGDWQG